MIRTKLFQLAFLLLAGAFATGPAAWAAEFEEGVHYHVLFEPQPVATGNRIEVLDIFWYKCPHCYAMEPLVRKWLVEEKPANVEYRRLPGVFRKATEFDARVYYALEQLGLADDLHGPIFEAIHFGKNRFKSIADVARVLEPNGVDVASFEAAFESETVKDKVRMAEEMYKNYEANGVPTVIVDGRFRASANSAGGYQELIDIVNFLVRLAASTRA